MKLIVTVFFAFLMLQNSTDLDTALKNHLDSFNVTPGSPMTYAVLGRTVSAGDDAAVVYLQPHSQPSGDPYPGVVDWAVALKDGTWSVYFPGDPGYAAAYDRLPPSLLRQANSSSYTIQADPARARGLDGYQLPYVDGAWATVTRSYRQHGTGRIDFDLGGSAEVAAAKDGVIVYADDHHTTNAYTSGAWWYWNTVIIQHGDHEFSLYGHLAPDSIPHWIKDACAADCAVPIHAGEVIAREGSTGYSSNPHLHAEFGQGYAVVTYPDRADENHDGNRSDPVYTGYVYAEQDVGFSGYSAAEVAGLGLRHAPASDSRRQPARLT